MVRDISLYEKVVEISQDFLGPAGERFIRRQIATHLDIEPENLRKRDIEPLVDWVRLTFALLTDNSTHVDAFAQRLTALSRQQPRSRTNHGSSSR